MLAVCGLDRVAIGPGGGAGGGWHHRPWVPFPVDVCVWVVSEAAVVTLAGEMRVALGYWS